MLKRPGVFLLALFLLFGSAWAEEEAFTYRWRMFSGMGGTVEFQYDGEGRMIEETHISEADGSAYRTIVHRYDDAGVEIAAWTSVRDSFGAEVAGIERMYVVGERPVTLYLAGFLTDGYDVLTEINYDMTGAVTSGALYDLLKHQGHWWTEKYDEAGRIRRIDVYGPDSFAEVQYSFHYSEEKPEQLEYVRRKTYDFKLEKLYPQYDEAGLLIHLISENGDFDIAFSHDAAGGFSGAAVHGEEISLIFSWTKDEDGLISSSSFTMEAAGGFSYVRAADGTMQAE